MLRTALFLLVFAGSAVAKTPLPIDADALEYEPVRFALVHKGETAGEMYYAMTRQDDTIIIHEATTMLPGTRESATAVIDAQSFTPQSIVLDGDFNRTIFDADLSLANGKMTGSYWLKRPDDIAKTEQAFETDMPEGAVARMSVFGFAAGLPLKQGDVYEFQWFSTLSRAVQTVSLEVAGNEQITTPAGTFDTVVLHLKATPENRIYVSKTPGPRVVRIDVIGMDMQFQRLPSQDAQDK